MRARGGKDRRHWAYITVGLFFFAIFLCTKYPWSFSIKEAPPLSRSFSALQKKAPAEEFPGFPVDLNTAGVEELVVLPGIGPVTARRILEKRYELGGFSEVDELKGVKWINDSKLEVIRTLVTVK